VAAEPVTPGDNDGLDDAWEIRHFGSLSAHPDDDPDGDGLTNIEEQREQTDPNNPDTDGDFAPDGLEISLGMNPLVRDVAPLTLKSPAPEMVVSEVLALETAGGSGSYAWHVAGTGEATIDASGVLIGVLSGPLTITAHDLLFPGLASNPVALNVLSESFGIRPASPVLLQPGGYLNLTAVGGSGFYEWTLSPGATATAQTHGAACILSPTMDDGVFEVTVKDLLVAERVPASAAVTIQAIPGDINGDSRVGLEDAIICLQVLSGKTPSVSVNPNGEVDGDGRAGMPEALFILRRVR
jgi:hypothetical protein